MHVLNSTGTWHNHPVPSTRMAPAVSSSRRSPPHCHNAISGGENPTRMDSWQAPQLAGNRVTHAIVHHHARWCTVDHRFTHQIGDSWRFLPQVAPTCQVGGVDGRNATRTDR